MRQTFGTFVREHRKARGMTLRGLAARLGIAPVYMSNIETDRKPAPSQEYLDMPDALKEKERERYPDLHSFLRAVVVPEMQIKLKQGFGRAIRTETDTCVVAILDERAVHGRRYFRDIVTALPEMPVTNSIQEVERFIRAVKPDSYFQEGVA